MSRTILPALLRCEYRHDPVGIDETQPRLSWIIEPSSPDARGEAQSAYQILVASSDDALVHDEGDLWDTGKVESAETNQIVYTGKRLKSRMGCRWKVRCWDAKGRVTPWSEVASWTMGLLDAKDWKAAWIAGPEPEVKEGDLHLPPASVFRRTFVLDELPKRAMLFASALGIYTAKVNGRRVGGGFFKPGWSDYRKRVYYNTNDIARYLAKGENVLEFTVADGWYAGYVGFNRLREHYGKEHRLLAQLHLEGYHAEDQVIASDETWEVTNDGPVREADLLMGETYDAHMETPGKWTAALPREAPAISLEAYPTDPVTLCDFLRPRAMTEPVRGTYVYDLGQNMVGVVRLRVEGPRGTRVQLRYAEVLQDDGMLYTRALRAARSTDVYTKKSDDPEDWTPEFTFHGFRYVELTGVIRPPALHDLTGLVLHNGFDDASSFMTSSVMVNKLHENVKWSQIGNHLEVPTDCPQRDERLGWTGDAQIFVRAGTYNYDIASFFTKWLRDLFDAQLEDGGFSNVAPDVLSRSGAQHSCAGWEDAAIICPYTIYRVYNDRRIVERYFAGMKRYMDHLAAKYADKSEKGLNFGDWLNLNSDTPRPVLFLAYYAFDARLMAEMAGAIGKKADQRKYAMLHEKLVKDFQTQFVQWDGRITGNTQTAYALALNFDLLAEGMKPKAIEYLVQDIAYRRGHHSTGFLGLRDLLPALSRNGRDDIAYKLLLNEEFPSWGYEIRHGATTIWERWDGWTEELGLQTPDMNSFNHYAYGAVNEWMFRIMAGIDLAEPGYRRLRIEPHLGPGIRHARMQYQSINGAIASQWRVEHGRRCFEFRIPPNTTAEIFLPAGKDDTLLESGRPLKAGNGIVEVDRAGDGTRLIVGSGFYTFTIG